MSEELMQSESVKELFGALAKAQAKISGAKKDALNPHLKSKYADLASVWEACRSALPEFGLCVVQTFKQAGPSAVCVVTTLGHSSGEWIRGEMFIPASKPDAQGLGSAATYARRYGLAAIVGVSPEDDDGDAATNPKEQRGPIKAPDRHPAPTCEQQAEALPQQLHESVSLMEKAVDANAMLAEAKTMGELNEAWGFVAVLKRSGLPAAHFSSLLKLKEKRKAELAAPPSAAE